MKAFLKKIVVAILSWQVKRLYKKNSDLIVIGVTGSVGKTSTKLAISKIVSQKFKTQYQNGNYNDITTIPLVFFGQAAPNLFNPFAWLKTLFINELKIAKKYEYEVVVIELGADGPGQLAKFKKFLAFDIGVLTAITPEHMEYFKTLEAVAAEEKEIVNLSKTVLLNIDMIPAEFLPASSYISYGMNKKADYRLTDLVFDESGCRFNISENEKNIFSGKHEAIAEPLMYAVLAAVSVAKKLGLTDEEIENGIAEIKPAPGRMQILPGVKGSTIIDDTYNASPEAVRAALKTLYRLDAKQRIAILGNMNELGEYSEKEHRDIGVMCAPDKLDLVVTIGPDANKYLAEEAERQGCQVKRFENPSDAGKFVLENIKPGSAILAKGSQNKVFAEEAVKELLNNPNDQTRLVRQSEQWLKKKKDNFK